MGGRDRLLAALTDLVALGIILGLVVGKPLGIVGTTWLLTKITRVRVDFASKKRRTPTLNREGIPDAYRQVGSPENH